VKIGRLWLVIAAACVVPAVLDGGLTYVQGVLAGRPTSWQEVFWQANEWLILGALTPLVYWLARRFPLSGGYIRNCALRAAFLAAHEGRPLNQGHLVRAIQLEYREIGKLSTTSRLE